MKLGLDSDFLDYYDHWFSSVTQKPEYVYSRQSKTNMAKWDQFYIMSKAGLRVPLHGNMYCTPALLKDSKRVVIYKDPYAHRGEGKYLSDSSEAYMMNRNSYCSEYIEGSYDEHFNPISYRMLSIGGKLYNLKYTGKPGSTTWQSNHAAEVDIQLIDNYESRTPKPKRIYEIESQPLWAIDYVVDEMGNFWAIDFNTSPQIKGTGIEEELSANDCFELIYGYIKENIQKVYGVGVYRP